jgi:hypothetical protein
MASPWREAHVPIRDVSADVLVAPRIESAR